MVRGVHRDHVSPCEVARSRSRRFVLSVERAPEGARSRTGGAHAERVSSLTLQGQTRWCLWEQTTVRVGFNAVPRSGMRRLMLGEIPGSRSSSGVVEVDLTPVLFPRIEDLHSRQCRNFLHEQQTSTAWDHPTVAAYPGAVPHSRTACVHGAGAKAPLVREPLPRRVKAHAPVSECVRGRRRRRERRGCYTSARRFQQRSRAGSPRCTSSLCDFPCVYRGSDDTDRVEIMVPGSPSRSRTALTE
jgi:hypothetical protein